MGCNHHNNIQLHGTINTKNIVSSQEEGSPRDLAFGCLFCAYAVNATPGLRRNKDHL